MSQVALRSGVSRRGLLAGLAWIGMTAAPAWANRASLPELATGLPGARLQGAGRLAFLGLAVYDIRLWVGEGFSAETFAQRPLAIEIEYARSLSGLRMAERSLDEMHRIAPLSAAQREAWFIAMKQAFPDVVKGDRLTGLYRPGADARFFLNGTLRAEVPDADFARTFFAIWLSPKTSEPRLRLALLGSGA
jgi:Chalcone isomerase-like